MSKEQIDIIRDLLIEFDEMGFIPTTTVPDPNAYAIKWRAEITKALEGYRKQSEGEWIKKSGLYVCSECDKTCPYDVQADDISYWECKFCPHCGAHMNSVKQAFNEGGFESKALKGGAE